MKKRPSHHLKYEDSDDEFIDHHKQQSSSSSSSSIKLPPKRKREQDLDNDEDNVNNKKPKTTVIFDDKGGLSLEDNGGFIVNSNNHSSTVNIISKDKLISNIIITSAFGTNLLLDPRTVFKYCKYWTSQYSNSTKKQDYWFNEMITNILQNPISIELISDIGFPSITDNLLGYRYLFSFIGGDLNRIPAVIFNSQKNDAFSFALSHFEHPSNKCFKAINNAGLRGEIQMTLFNYNDILDYFFEPSFVVISCFADVIPYLIYGSVDNIIKPSSPQVMKKEAYHQLKNEYYQHLIPVIEKMIKSIDFDDMTEFKCLNKSNPFYEENLARLKLDLNELKIVLDRFSQDVQQTKLDLLQLWSKKAEFCTFHKQKRLEFVCNKYCL